MTGIVAIADGLPNQTDLQWPQDASRVDADVLRARAADYLRLAAHAAPADVRRLVDKQPYNFLHIGHIGLIAMLFADARIVWCRRDPRDIALSIFSEGFAPSATYATDLEDIAFVIAQQERLMHHWQSVSPLPIIEMQYETVVIDTETEIRRLIDRICAPLAAGAIIRSGSAAFEAITRRACIRLAYTRQIYTPSASRSTSTRAINSSGEYDCALALPQTGRGQAMSS